MTVDLPGMSIAAKLLLDFVMAHHLHAMIVRHAGCSALRAARRAHVAVAAGRLAWNRSVRAVRGIEAAIQRGMGIAMRRPVFSRPAAVAASVASVNSAAQCVTADVLFPTEKP